MANEDKKEIKVTFRVTKSDHMRIAKAAKKTCRTLTNFCCFAALDKATELALVDVPEETPETYVAPRVANTAGRSAMCNKCTKDWVSLSTQPVIRCACNARLYLKADGTYRCKDDE